METSNSDQDASAEYLNRSTVEGGLNERLKARLWLAPWPGVPAIDYSSDPLWQRLRHGDTEPEDAAILGYLTPDQTPQPQPQAQVHSSTASFKSPPPACQKQAQWQHHSPVTRSRCSSNLFSLSNASGKVVRHSGRGRILLSLEQASRELVRSRYNWEACQTKY